MKWLRSFWGYVNLLNNQKVSIKLKKLLGLEMITENKLIYVLNGPNLNLLGLREPEIYGYETFDEIKSMMKEHADKLGFAIDVRQTNHEGVLVDWLQEAYEKSARAVILNAAAYTHTSIALHDAIKAIPTPVIEVHLSDPIKREGFRHLSYVGMAAVKCIKGQGANGYLMALDAVAKDKI